MNASRPEADTEYSRGDRASRGPRRARRASLRHPSTAVLGLGLLGAGLLLAAELTPLLRVDTVAAHPRLVRTVMTGPHHAYALVPIAIAAVLLAQIAARTGRRSALAGVALLGLGALAVALIADRPDVHATGLVGTPATGLHEAQAQAGPGLYLETLGGIVLLLAAAGGMLLAPSPTRRRTPRRAMEGPLPDPQGSETLQQQPRR